jgi:hypothetical protein
MLCTVVSPPEFDTNADELLIRLGRPLSAPLQQSALQFDYNPHECSLSGANLAAGIP